SRERFIANLFPRNRGNLASVELGGTALDFGHPFRREWRKLAFGHRIPKRFNQLNAHVDRQTAGIGEKRIKGTHGQTSSRQLYHRHLQISALSALERRLMRNPRSLTLPARRLPLLPEP